jgi:hypothetical protein
MLWELFGSDAKVAAALAQSKGYDISPKSITTMPQTASLTADDIRAEDVTCKISYRTPRA